eukprot:364328-Chlamydomonas_euryale.AAC.4
MPLKLQSWPLCWLSTASGVRPRPESFAPIRAKEADGAWGCGWRLDVSAEDRCVTAAFPAGVRISRCLTAARRRTCRGICRRALAERRRPRARNL